MNSRSRAQITHEASIAALPHGAFIGLDGLFWLVFKGKLLRYTPFGYDDARAKPDGMATVLTPRPSIEALRRGFVPVLHPSAMGL